MPWTWGTCARHARGRCSALAAHFVRATSAGRVRASVRAAARSFALAVPRSSMRVFILIFNSIFCSYDSNYDRVFCLTCNDAISRGLGSGSIFGTAHQHHQLPPAPARQHLLSSYFAPISVQSSSSSSSSSAAGASSSPIAFGRRSSTSGGTGRSSPPNAPRSSPPSSLW